MKHFALSIVLTVLWLAAPALSFAEAAAFYVDPVHGSDTNPGTKPNACFCTIEKAQAVAKTAGGGTVYLRNGLYRLQQPLIFSADDSGRLTIYKAYATEHPILSGGKIISGWTLHDPARDIWQANIDPKWNFRQLYVNGRKASRTAAPPPPGATKNATGYAITDASLSRLRNPTDIEIVTRPHPWQVERLRIASIAPDRIVLSQPGLDRVTHGEYPGYGAIVRLENAYEWIRNAGDWYLDRAAGRLYYKPRAGENLATAVVEAPQLEQLIVLKGSAEHPVSNLQFSGLTFTTTNWLGPSRATGLITSQSNQMDPVPGEAGCAMPAAAIETTGAHNVTIDRCTFLQLGGQGINLLRASCDDTISRCDFHDLAASAIQVGSVGSAVAQLPVDSPDIVSGITISDCTVHHVATEYPCGCGILLGHVRDCAVLHNELFDLPYTGISLGWGWVNAGERALYRSGNRIAFNRIHDYLKELIDGGAIYVLGYEKDGLITGNYVYDQHHDFALIYLDDGATNWTVTSNVAQGRSTGMAWYLYKGSDNHASGNFTDTPKLINQAPPPGDKTCTVEKTIVVSDEKWPTEARHIMAESGPR